MIIGFWEIYVEFTVRCGREVDCETWFCKRLPYTLDPPCLLLIAMMSVSLPIILFAFYSTIHHLVYKPLMAACLISTEEHCYTYAEEARECLECSTTVRCQNQDCPIYSPQSPPTPIVETYTPLSINAMDNTRSTRRVFSSPSSPLSFDTIRTNRVELARNSPKSAERDGGYMTSLGDLEEIQLSENNSPIRTLPKTPCPPKTPKAQSTQLVKRKKTVVRRDTTATWTCCGGLDAIMRWHRLKRL